jgi:hypothetical protein
MSVSPSSVPNTETKYHNPASTGVEDIRGLLIRLETMQIDNTISGNITKISFNNILEKVHRSIYPDMWEYFILTVIYDNGMSDNIRIGILNLSQLLCPIHNDIIPKEVIVVYYKSRKRELKAKLM